MMGYPELWFYPAKSRLSEAGKKKVLKSLLN